jgi:hypothetical protein
MLLLSYSYYLNNVCPQVNYGNKGNLKREYSWYLQMEKVHHINLLLKNSILNIEEHY